MTERDDGEKSNSQLVVIVMGSQSDLEYCRKIITTLDEFGVSWEARVCSAHKDTGRLLSMIDEYKEKEEAIVYIAVAGRSNALGGVIDANTTSPVINAPPPSDKFGGMDILSSLRMPSGSGALTVIEAEAAAIGAVKIFSLYNPELSDKLVKYQENLRSKVLEADIKIQDGSF